MTSVYCKENSLRNGRGTKIVPRQEILAYQRRGGYPTAHPHSSEVGTTHARSSPSAIGNPKALQSDTPSASRIARKPCRLRAPTACSANTQ